MGVFCVAFALFGGMILIALCGMGVESTGAENSCQGGGFVKYRCSADKKRGKPVGKIDQLRSEWYNKGVF